MYANILSIFYVQCTIEFNCLRSKLPVSTSAGIPSLPPNGHTNKQQTTFANAPTNKQRPPNDLLQPQTKTAVASVSPWLTPFSAILFYFINSCIIMKFIYYVLPSFADSPLYWSQPQRDNRHLVTWGPGPRSAAPSDNGSVTDLSTPHSFQWVVRLK